MAPDREEAAMSGAMTPEKLRQLLDLRKSNAAAPVPSGKKYSRREKHRGRDYR